MSTMAITVSSVLAETGDGSGIATSVPTYTYTSDSIISITPSIPTATTDQQVNIAFTVAALKALLIYSDYAVTIETNDGTTPDDTLSIAAGIPFLWLSGSGITCPITATVTKFYITNASGSTATVKIRALVDGTP